MRKDQRSIHQVLQFSQSYLEAQYMYKKIALFLMFALALVFKSSAAITASQGKKLHANSTGKKLYKEAQRLESKAYYFSALKAYKQAKPLLVKEGMTDLADQCRYALTRIKNITNDYTYTLDDVKKMIKENYPDTTDKRIDQIIKDGRLPHMTIEGKTYYFSGFLNTLFYLYPEFRVGPRIKLIDLLIDLMGEFIYEKDILKPGQPLTKPFHYKAEGEAVIPRNKLAEKGLLKVWMPLPLVNSAQQKLEIVSIYPEEYIRYPIKTDGDIGLVYFEIPLEEIQDDLKVGAKFNFTHYEERFEIDPYYIGEYDKDSELYKRYTASYKNTTITPDIAKKAQEIAGDETNPFFIAKEFYYHIVYDLDYSLTPHGALDALKIPESVYVHEHGYGDCGAQSMYFAALCRAVGIPARSSGGMELFPFKETGCGGHFWAQFYLPNYGWIPVDTSVGQNAKYDPNMTDQEEIDFIEYFFGNMDPYRYLIQVDVDVPLIPPPTEPLVISTVLQMPTAICEEMDESPGYLFFDSNNWKITVKREDK